MTKQTSAAQGGKLRQRADNADLIGPNSEIGRKLRQYYDGIVSEDIPERFSQLLIQLEQVETSQKKG